MDWFDKLCHGQRAALDVHAPAMAAWLRQQDALHLSGTIGSDAVLRRDGTVRIWWADRWPDSDEPTAERDATPLERIGALVLGARRMPQVGALLPPRPPAVEDCAECGGRGAYRNAEGVLCPACAGLGWVPPAI